jgi:hypothetical protein
MSRVFFLLCNRPLYDSTALIQYAFRNENGMSLQSDGSPLAVKILFVQEERAL